LSLLLFLILLLALGSRAWAQPEQEICLSQGDAQKALRCLMAEKLKDEKISILEQQLAVAKKEAEIAKQELQFEKRLTEIAQREADVYKLAFEKEKELTDRALKLAEISKPQSDWKMQGLALLGAILMGIAIGK
jgi:hypothetical protein